MTAKDALKEKLKSLPDGYQNVLDAVLPSVSEISQPSDVDSALIVQGQLAAYLLEVFNRLAGLPVLEVPLRIGQFVPAQHVMAAVGLEFIGAAESGPIEMIMPVDGGNYYGAVTEVRCRVEGVSGVTVNDGGETFELDQESEDVWAGLWAFAIGDHSITVTADTESTTISFSVGYWPITPEDGSTVTDPNIEISVNSMGDESISGVSVNIDYEDGDSDNVTLEQIGELWSLAVGVYELFKHGPVILTFLIATEYGEFQQESQIFWEQFEPPPA